MTAALPWPQTRAHRIGPPSTSLPATMPRLHSPTRVALLLAASLLALPAAAQHKHEHKHDQKHDHGKGGTEAAHQHGLARLEVALDGTALQLVLDSPLDNLVGFERAPRNEAERGRVRTMAERLHAAAGLVAPDAAAGCSLQAVQLESAVLDAALLAAPGATAPKPAAAAPAAADSGHADLEATIGFQCRQPQALKRIALDGLFKAFPRLKQLDVALVAPGVQRGLRATPQKPQLSW